jgi:hypothetical protein
LRNFLNITIAVALVAVGLAAIRLSDSIGSVEGAASLAGALFGAAALFIGAEITKADQRARTTVDLNESRARIRTALMGELVTFWVNHMESARFFRGAAKALGKGHQMGQIDFERYIPPETPIYDALLAQMTLLLEAEVDALATFHTGVGRTRRALQELTGVEHFGLLKAEALARQFEHDCEIGAKVASLLAPTRKIQRPGEEPRLLSEVLRQVAEGG